MWQFMLGSDAAFAALEVRARRACVKFRSQEMPPGSDPTVATIGIEIDPLNGVARLLVARGINYSGPNDEIRNWCLSGQRSFDSFTQLKTWLATTLRTAFMTTATTLRVALDKPDNPVVPGAESELDDVDANALRIAMRNIRKRDDLPS